MSIKVAPLQLLRVAKENEMTIPAHEELTVEYLREILDYIESLRKDAEDGGELVVCDLDSVIDAAIAAAPKEK